MCKEDIRLARAAKANKPYNVAGVAGRTKIFGANGERYSLTVHGSVVNPITAIASGLLYALVNGIQYPLIGITAEHPSDTINITDVGSVIMEEIWFNSTGTDAFATLFVGESQFNQKQADI